MFFIMFVLSLIFTGVSCSKDDMTSFNVVDFGAVDGGKTDSSQAFLEAWMAACNGEIAHVTSQVIVPEKMSFLVNPVTFSGPCKVKNINFLVFGTIIAPDSPSNWDEQDASEWVVFKTVSRLMVGGLGTIDGRGKGWWDQSCRGNPESKGCTKLAPTALKFLSCNDSSLRNIFITNSPQTHVLLHWSYGFVIDYVNIQSPESSPNTDGIHIHASHHLAITNSRIGSGDDCISVGDYVSYLDIVNIYCGPGHGISIGSLGSSGNVVQVENIRVINAILNRTTNGARIKTWQMGRGHVRGVTFENMRFISVKYPIIIDQNYCDIRGKCKELDTGVQISQVLYRGMYGTSFTDAAIVLNCSRVVPCYGISMEYIRLTPAITERRVTAECGNAYGQEFEVEPGPCLVQIKDGYKGAKSMAASPNISK
ncbi:hypothetical protein LIER_09705 [Lithospermum erythrorhizon]|uniref:Polygalacturonase n=1 Tax=Lithospermum erythrorhizon TaxID=34254 RepID=A0AAV3PIY7_LITER